MVSYLVGPEIVVADATAGGGTLPVLSALAGGGFVCTWVDPASPDPDIRARFYGADGLAVGVEFVVSAQAGGVQGAPGVVTLADGTVAFVWASVTDGGTDILARVFSAQGLPLTDDLTIATGLPGVQGGIVLGARADGGFVACWAQGTAGSAQLWAAGVDSAGVAAPAFAVTEVATADQRDASLVMLDGGGFAVAWTNQTGSVKDVQLRLFDSQMAPVEGETAVHVPMLAAQTKPALTELSDGSFVLVWQSLVGAKTQIMARHFDAAGQATGDAFLVSASVDGQRNAAVTAQTDGGYCVVWEEVIGGDFGDIRIARFDPQGRQVWQTATLPAPSVDDQARPQIATLADGRLAVVWRDAGDVTAHIVDARLQVMADGTGAVTGQSPAPWLLLDGDRLTVNGAGALSVANQHCVQADLAADQRIVLEISGEIAALGGSGGYNAVNLQGLGSGNITLTATGVIRAVADGGAALALGAGLAIQCGDGADAIRNAGTIAGHVALAGGDDLYDGRGGTVTGEVRGGAGNDRYVVSAPGLVMVEKVGAGKDTVYSSVSITLAANLEGLILQGSSGLRGTGNASGNQLAGSSGGDRLFGMGGRDDLRGGGGADTLTGGLGRDTLTGGAGADDFIFEAALTSPRASADVITDFRPGIDDIDLHSLIGPKLAFRGAADFGLGPQVRTVVQGANTLIEIDLNGDARADMGILCQGAKGFTAGDFIL